MFLDKKLKNFKQRAFQLIKKKSVRHVLFSDNSYEIAIKDNKKIYWPFIHLDDEGKILDAFCGCRDSEIKGGCEHILAAYLTIFNKAGRPLHERYEGSFFYEVFFSLAKEENFRVSQIKRSKNGYHLGKMRIKIQDAQKQKLFQEIIKSNNEGSVSFKATLLSFDDLALYKEGKASDKVKFEMSIFSDIAKWLFLQKEKQKGKYLYFIEKQEIPARFEVRMEKVKLFYQFNIEQLLRWLPYLKKEKSNLRIFPSEERIDKITFNEEKGCFVVFYQAGKAHPEKAKSKKEIDGWIYVKKSGFYEKQKNPEQEVDVFEYLNHHLKLLKAHLEGLTIFDKAQDGRYNLFFDGEESLHIEIGVEEEHKSDQRLFGHWLYMPGKGFYLLKNLLFREVETVILKKNLSSFLDEKREFLNSTSSFSVHFSNFEKSLTYQFTNEGDLLFLAKEEQEENKKIEFDGWSYIKGRGFYLKKTEKEKIYPNLLVKKENIEKFLDKSRDDLEKISGFFTDINPIKRLGLNIFISDENEIILKPEVEIKPEYQERKIKFFGGYLFLDKKGFYKIFYNVKLPQKYDREMKIKKEREFFFLVYELDRLKPYIIDLDKRLKIPEKLQLKLKQLRERRRGIKKFYELSLDYFSESGRVSAKEMAEAIFNGKRYIFSDAGCLFLNLPRFAWLKNLGRFAIKREEDILRFSSLELMRLCLYEELYIDKDKKEERKKLEEIKNLEISEMLDLSLLLGNLRPYQETGVKWLWFLYCHQLSGLLCDEMGLGKTFQAMGLVGAVFKENSKVKFLVICPTSVIYHWQDLLERFLPGIRVLPYHGIARSLAGFEDEYDLLLTSYGLARQEEDKLKKISFELAIFDEIQIAKNQFSQIHASLKKLKAQMKLGLTGTPIENNLWELKALFDLVLPLYLPEEKIFNEYFINPIEKEGDEKAKRLLSKLIQPFILRRKKRQVLVDLPEKVEEKSYADLSNEQKKLYNEVLDKYEDTITKGLAQNKISYAHIFSIISKLKQICDHPALYLKQVDNFEEYASGKWELFLELLQEARDSSQKVVIFSHYLDMLAIIERYLKKQDIGFASIKGMTRKRFEQVKRFKEDEKCEVFTASLLAAGLGIDLSCASVVIHYDRWWNPAKENQATDRVHRIGQSRGVQVFKLITKSTIEEKIDQIITRKGKLIEGTIKEDELRQIKYLDRNELISILTKLS